MESKVSIVILNWNGWKHTLECLSSLSQITYSNYNIILVDNGSTDGSIEKIRDYVDKKWQQDKNHEEFLTQPIHYFEFDRNELLNPKNYQGKISPFTRNFIFIKNEKNYGFAEGNNIAIHLILETMPSEYILLLNNDVIVDRDFLTELIKIARSAANIGIVGPKIYYYDYLGRKDVINFAGQRSIIWKGRSIIYGFNEIDKGQQDSVRETDVVHGACMLIKTKLINEIGTFDSDFFAYWEETDFCFRASRVGYKLLYVPYAKIWHKISASTNSVLHPLPIYYLARNYFLFMYKNIDGYKKLISFFYFFYYRLWVKSASYLFRYKNSKAFLSYIKGVKDGMIYKSKKY
jgi:GT2 family glycosyltransferase